MISFQKLGPEIFLGIVMGAACIYASHPYMMPIVEKFSKQAVKENVGVVDKRRSPAYPVGTFEHEVKRTL